MRLPFVLVVIAGLLFSGCSLLPSVPGLGLGATATPTRVSAAAVPTDAPRLTPTLPATALPATPTVGATSVVTRTATPGAAITATVGAARTVTATAPLTGTAVAGRGVPVGTEGDIPAIISATVQYALSQGVTGFEVTLGPRSGDFARTTVTRRSSGAVLGYCFLRKTANTWSVIYYGSAPPAGLGIPDALGLPRAAGTPALLGATPTSVPTLVVTPIRTSTPIR